MYVATFPFIKYMSLNIINVFKINYLCLLYFFCWKSADCRRNDYTNDTD